MNKTNETADMRLRVAGAEYGRDLAAAVILAAHRAQADREHKRQMAQIVLRKIAEAVTALRELCLPEELVSEYERACRSACRDELLRSIGAETPDAPLFVRTAA